VIIYRVYDDSTDQTHGYFEDEYDAEDACDLIREDRCFDDWRVEPLEVHERASRKATKGGEG